MSSPKRRKTAAATTGHRSDNHAWDIPATARSIEWHGLPPPALLPTPFPPFAPPLFFSPDFLTAAASQQQANNSPGKAPAASTAGTSGRIPVGAGILPPPPQLVTSDASLLGMTNQEEDQQDESKKHLEKEQEANMHNKKKSNSASSSDEEEKEKKKDAVNDESKQIKNQAQLHPQKPSPFYHPIRNKLDIILDVTGKSLLCNPRLVGNNRLRVLLYNMTSSSNEDDDFEQSRLAMEAVQVLEEHWKSNVYKSHIIPSRKKNKIKIVLSEILHDEDELHDVLLNLLQQTHDLSFLKSCREGKKASQASSQRQQAAEQAAASPQEEVVDLQQDQDKKMPAKPTGNAVPDNTNEERPRKRRARVPRVSLEPQKRQARDSPIVDDDDENNKAMNSLNSSASLFLPTGFDQDEMMQLREAAVQSLKEKKQRDQAFERRDSARAAFLASQLDQGNFKEGIMQNVTLPQQKAPAAASTSPAAPAWRELSAMEALCALNQSSDDEKKDPQGDHDDDDEVVVLDAPPSKKKRAITPPHEVGEEEIDREDVAPVQDDDSGTTESNHDVSHVRTKTEEAWTAMYQRLRRYKEEHGDCLVPYNWEEDRKLGDWVSVQRKRKKKGMLSEDRIARLEKVSFVWALRKQVPWDIMFEKLVEFKTEHGHLAVPLGYPPCPKLGRWVVDQRNNMRRGGLNEDRTARLEALGFVSKAWVQKREARAIQQRRQQDQELREALQQRMDNNNPGLLFRQQLHQHKKELQQRMQQHKLELQEQRHEKQPPDDVSYILPKPTAGERTQRLPIPPRQQREDAKIDDLHMQWDVNFAKLVMYKERNGNTSVPERYEVDYSFGEWVAFVRSHEECLKPKEKKQLESLGFVFSYIQQLPWDSMVRSVQYEAYKQAQRQAALFQKWT